MKVIHVCLSVVLAGGLLISPRGVALESNEAAHVHGLAELTLIRDGNDVDVEFISPTVNLLGFERQPETTGERKHAMQVAELLTKPSQLFNFDGGNCSIVKIQPQIPFTSATTQAVETPEQHHKHAGDEDHDAHASHEGHQDHDAHASHEGHKDHDEHAGHEGHQDHDAHASHEGHKDHDDHASHEGHKDHDVHASHEGHKDHDADASHEGHKDHDDHASHEGHQDHDAHASHEGHEHKTKPSTENNSLHTNAAIKYQFSCVNGAKMKSMSVTMFSQFPNLEAVDLMFVNGNTQGAARLTASDNKVRF